MKSWILAIALILALTLAACSDGDDESSVTEGDPEHGAEIFKAGVDEEAPPCSTCHQTGTGGSSFSLGPNLADIATRAGTRVDGLRAEQYVHQSIVDPESFIVPGFRVSMYTGYAEHLSEQDIADLIAYLLSL